MPIKHSSSTGAVKSTEPVHIVGLDLLRFLAASVVMFYHFFFWHWTRGQDILVNTYGSVPLWSGTFHFGWVGVEIFFVISGFVITSSARGATASDFFRSRFLRLVPAAWICATISAVWLLISRQRQPYPLFLDYVSTLVFWPLRAIDGVYWTLGIEIAFYALVYYLLYVKRSELLEKLMIIVGAGSGLFWIAALVGSHVFDNRLGIYGTLHFLILKAEGNRWLQLLLIPHGCLFGLGVVLSRVCDAGATKARKSSIVLLSVACILEIVGQNTIIERATALSLSPFPAIFVWVAAMIAFAISLRFNGFLAEALGRCTTFLRFAGLLTYPLYLIHNTVVFFVSVLLAARFGYSAIFVGMIAAVIVAGLVAAFAEPALRKYLSKFWPRTFLRGARQSSA